MTNHVNPAGLISRATWGAKEDDGFADRPVPVTEFWLHHSVTIAPDLLPPFTDDDAAVRTLERIGESRFGGGISYNVPVTPVGRGYVGVSWWRRGAHTKGHNTVAAAFVLVGDYNKMQVTQAQMRKIAETMVDAHRKGIATRHTLNGGHQNASGNAGTECPGKNGMAAIPLINALANRLWSMPKPKPKPPVKPPAFPGLCYYGWRNSATVKAWQKALNKYRAYHLSEDGDFGPSTLRAVRDAQRRGHLVIDGVPGKKTWDYIT